MYIIICETDHQSSFDAWNRLLRAVALGWPWGIGWGCRWEGCQDGEHMYTHGWFMSIYGKSHKSIVKHPIKINELIKKKTLLLVFLHASFIFNGIFKPSKNCKTGKFSDKQSGQILLLTFFFSLGKNQQSFRLWHRKISYCILDIIVFFLFS